jgi:hypothetical protein
MRSLEVSRVNPKISQNRDRRSAIDPNHGILPVLWVPMSTMRGMSNSGGEKGGPHKGSGYSDRTENNLRTSVTLY